MRPPIAYALAAVASAAVAQVPNKLGYQGRLMRSDGTPETGVVPVTFSVFDVATAGAGLGCDAAQLALNDGFYAVFLGNVGGCPGNPPGINPSSFDGRDLWLEMTVGGVALSPRQRIASVPYAQRAGTASTAVNVRGGTVEATSVTVGGSSGMTVSASGIQLGTTTVVDASGKATVATGKGLTGDGSSAAPVSVAAGGITNAEIATNAAIGFGKLAHADGDHAGLAQKPVSGTATNLDADGNGKIDPSLTETVSGKVIGVTYHVSGTRTVLSPTASIAMESFTVNKRSPTSILIVQGTLSGRGNHAGDMQQGWKYGSGTEVMAQSVMYGQTVYSKIYSTSAVIAGHATTGPQTMVFRYFKIGRAHV